MNYSQLQVPEYNPKGKESINQYIRRVEKYKTIILKEKYDIILNFVNDWLNKNIKYESLTKFTNIKEYILLKNDKHNRIVMQKYSELFNNNFKITINIPQPSEENSDVIKDKYILTFLTKLLDYIDYALIKREFKGKFIYSIRKV
jgi:type IV secretory pathway component VirB8